MDTKLNAFDDDPNYLKGLGGWLIVVAIGIVLNPIFISYQLSQGLFPMFFDGTLAIMSDPSSEYYIEGFAGLFYLELSLNIILLLAELTLLFLFFYKHKMFPTAFIAVVIATPIVMLIHAIAISQVIPGVDIFDAETTFYLVRSVFYAAIWIPYMLVSERVKKTFTRPENDRMDTTPAVVGEI